MSEAVGLELLVLADDRTGALETAGACADAGWVTVVTAFGDTRWPPPHRCRVVDLATRHLDPLDAVTRVAAAIDTSPDRRHDAHKIDSTLRGNWAFELVERYRRTGRRTVVVPAFPAAGRTCVGGVVREHDVPVAEGPAGRDPLRAVASSSPAEHLRAAGAGSVVEVEDATELARWRETRSPFAVCDAAADVDLVLLAHQWADHPGVVFAGTAAAIAAAARVLAGESAHLLPPPPIVHGHVLVVSGSLHPVAREQIATLRAAGRNCTIVTAPERDARAGHAVDPEEAQRAARLLAASARRMLNRREHAAVLIVGGDTAAAVLGDAPLVVGGTVDTGVPWCRVADGTGPLVLTKPGGFGGAEALVDLVDAILQP